MFTHPQRHITWKTLCVTGALLLSACSDCNTSTPPSTRDMQGVDETDMSPGDMPRDQERGDMNPVDMPRDTGGDDRDHGRDMEQDAGDSGADLEDMPPVVDMPGDQGEDMADMDPGVVTCPTDLRNSCLYQALSCFGDTTERDACYNDPLLGQQVSVFRNGSQAIYRQRPTASGPRQEFRTISGEGQMCYLAIAQQDVPSPETWEFRDGATMFKHFISIDDSEVRVTCASGEVEICSRTKFDLYFTWPDTPPEGCPDKDPDDLCDLDGDCPSGQLCCRLGDAANPKQCVEDDICIPNRAPKNCEVDADCSPSEECSRCDRSGRECVPLGFTSNAMNSLSCEPDQCDPTQMNACGAGPQTCCISGGSFSCVIPSECDSPPDPNPMCDVNAQQPCVNPNQDCCYVSQLNQFRCIDGSATCRTNVCYSDVDCPSNQECCNANPAAGTPGACLSQCENEVITCGSDADCSTAGAGAFCCQYPGYAVGTCEIIAENCRIITCEMGASQCDGNDTCCNAAPLTTATCIAAGSSCPPEPVMPN